MEARKVRLEAIAVRSIGDDTRDRSSCRRRKRGADDKSGTYSLNQ
jgi:hypothetical protein